MSTHPMENLIDVTSDIVAQWPCLCPDAHRASHCYIAECPQHTLGPELVVCLERSWAKSKHRLVERSVTRCLS